MKAFVLGTVLAIALAAGAGFVLEGFFSRDSYLAFSTPSSRVDHHEVGEGSHGAAVPGRNG